MTRLKSFLITTVLGGLTVILPMVILVAVFGWLFSFITNLIQPLTNIIVARADTKEFIADVIVIIIILAVCFFVGLFVKTRIGHFFVSSFENSVFRSAPGYKLIKETVLQLLGSKRPPFSGVALAHIYENSVTVTAFITDEHPDGGFTVFVPTAPNPTSGFIYHLGKKYVRRINVPIEDAMRTVLSCGAGSHKLIEEYKSKLS